MGGELELELGMWDEQPLQEMKVMEGYNSEDVWTVALHVSDCKCIPSAVAPREVNK